MSQLRDQIRAALERGAYCADCERDLTPEIAESITDAVMAVLEQRAIHIAIPANGWMTWADPNPTTHDQDNHAIGKALNMTLATQAARAVVL